jgi:hypothetical protein
LLEKVGASSDFVAAFLFFATGFFAVVFFFAAGWAGAAFSLTSPISSYPFLSFEEICFSNSLVASSSESNSFLRVCPLVPFLPN